MTQIGDVFAFADGTEWLVERAPDEDPDGAVAFRVTVPPSVMPPPPHRHPSAVDAYEVLEGSFAIQVNGEWQVLASGDSAAVPAQTVHTIANRSGATAVVRNTHTPASDFDAFVAHGDRLLRARGVRSPKDIRVPILFSMLTLEYPRTLLPGRRRDAIATKAFAGIGRLLRMNTAVDTD